MFVRDSGEFDFASSFFSLATSEAEEAINHCLDRRIRVLRSVEREREREREGKKDPR